MAAIKFTCKTSDKESHEEIKRLVYLAGGAITREKVYEMRSSFSAEIDIVNEGGSLYRQLKDSPLVISIFLHQSPL